MQTLANWRLSLLERTTLALDHFSTSRSARRNESERAPHLITGERGEETAFFFLRRQGYIVVAQRWNDCPLPGDIDLIAWDGGVLCFIEVKTRSSDEIATASSAVDAHKRRTLRRLARQYIRQLPDQEDPAIRPPTRFDIVAIYERPTVPREIRLMRGAFGWSEKQD